MNFSQRSQALQGIDETHMVLWTKSRNFCLKGDQKNELAGPSILNQRTWWSMYTTTGSDVSLVVPVIPNDLAIF